MASIEYEAGAGAETAVCGELNLVPLNLLGSLPLEFKMSERLVEKEREGGSPNSTCENEV